MDDDVTRRELEVALFDGTDEGEEYSPLSELLYRDVYDMYKSMSYTFGSNDPMDIVSNAQKALLEQELELRGLFGDNPFIYK